MATDAFIALFNQHLISVDSSRIDVTKQLSLRLGDVNELDAVSLLL